MSGMGRKQYQMVADVLADVPIEHFDVIDDTHGVLDYVRNALADAFQRDNPYFDRRHFLVASGGEPRPVADPGDFTP